MGGGLFKLGKPGAPGAEGDGLEDTQLAGVAQGKAS